MTHTDNFGHPLEVGNTVQAVVDPNVGTNRERWYGWIESMDDQFAYVTQDCWYDVFGQRHELRGVMRVHPANLRRLFYIEREAS